MKMSSGWMGVVDVELTPPFSEDACREALILRGLVFGLSILGRDRLPSCRKWSPFDDCLCCSGEKVRLNMNLEEEFLLTMDLLLFMNGFYGDLPCSTMATRLSNELLLRRSGSVNSREFAPLGLSTGFIWFTLAELSDL